MNKTWLQEPSTIVGVALVVGGVVAVVVGGAAHALGVPFAGDVAAAGTAFTTSAGGIMMALREGAAVQTDVAAIGADLVRAALTRDPTAAFAVIGDVLATVRDAQEAAPTLSSVAINAAVAPAAAPAIGPGSVVAPAPATP
jgi:hypothetical protein